MTRVQIRRRALAEHRSIRELLARLEATASAITSDRGRQVRELEEGLLELRRELRAHLQWEGRVLPEVLLDADAPGLERAAQMASAHEELELVLDFCRHSCGGEEHPLILARHLRDLMSLVRGTIASEERIAIRADVLREDVVTIDPLTN